MHDRHLDKALGNSVSAGPLAVAYGIPGVYVTVGTDASDSCSEHGWSRVRLIQSSIKNNV